MTDPLIDRLVGDLSPQKPLLNWKLWAHCATCLVMIAVAILAFMGLRRDYPLAMQSGALFWKPGMFLLAWIGSILLITDISRPVGTVRKIHLFPFVFAAAILVWQAVDQTAHSPFADIKNSLFDGSARYCLSVILGGGSVALMMAWKFWFSKTASPKPTLLGFLAGLSAGTLAAAAYALHCDRDFALYIAIYYLLPVLSLGLFGGFLGHRYLRW